MLWETHVPRVGRKEILTEFWLENQQEINHSSPRRMLEDTFEQDNKYLVFIKSW
jgi:hypothetical protein